MVAHPGSSGGRIGTHVGGASLQSSTLTSAEPGRECDWSPNFHLEKCDKVPVSSALPLDLTARE